MWSSSLLLRFPTADKKNPPQQSFLFPHHRRDFQTPLMLFGKPCLLDATNTIKEQTISLQFCDIKCTQNSFPEIMQDSQVIIFFDIF